MKYFLVIIWTFVSIQMIFSQQYFNQVYRSDPDSLYGTYFGSIVATDSAYYLSGLTVTLSPSFHNVGLFTKLDLDGNRILQRTYGVQPQTTEMWFTGLQATEDGNFIKIGLHRDNSICLLKVSPKGDVIFNKSYFPSSDGDRLFSWGGLAPTHDKGWLLSAQETQGFHHLLILIKTDSLGEEVCRWEYDFPNYDHFSGNLLAETDGGFIVSAIRTQGDPDIDTTYRVQTHVFKIDSTGLMRWEYYTSVSERLNCPFIVKTSDGGLILAGSESIQFIDNVTISYWPRGYIQKINLTRQFLWEKRMGSIGDSYFNRVFVKKNGLYAMGQNLNADSTIWGAWVVKLSETDGEVDFERIIGHDFLPNESKWRYSIDAAATHDNGFILCGYIDLYCNFGDDCGYWGWVTKLDSMGCVMQGCHNVGIEDDIAEKHPVRVFPNPAQDRISFKWDRLPQFSELHIYDVLGKEIVRKEINRSALGFELDIYLFQKGVYVYYLKGKDSLVVSGKFFKN